MKKELRTWNLGLGKRLAFRIPHSPSSKLQARAYSRGFTLLLAALVSSLVLTLGLVIVSIARKSVNLSSIGRDSQFAFYTADTASECALYWDIRFDRFPTTTPSGAVQITCDNETKTLTVVGSNPVVSTFQYEPNGRCADVTVTKKTTHPRTTIRADGYSMNCAAIANNPRTLQRSVEIRY